MPGFPALILLEQRKLASTPFSWHLRNLARTRPDSIEGRSAARALNAVRVEGGPSDLPDLRGVDSARRQNFNSDVRRMSQLAGGGITSPLDLLRNRGERIGRTEDAAHQNAGLPSVLNLPAPRVTDYPDRVLAKNLSPAHDIQIGRNLLPEELNAQRHRFSALGAHEPEPGVANINAGRIANPQIQRPDTQMGYGKVQLPGGTTATPRKDVPDNKLPYDPSKIIYRAHQPVADEKPLWASPHPDVPARYTKGINENGDPRSFVAKGLPANVRPDVHYSPHLGDDGLTQQSPRTAATPDAAIPPDLSAKFRDPSELPDYETTMPGRKFEALPTLAHVPPARLPAYGFSPIATQYPNAYMGMSKRIMGVESGTTSVPSPSTDQVIQSNVGRLNAIIQRRAAKLSALDVLQVKKEAAGLLTDAQRSQMFSEIRAIARQRAAAKAAQPPKLTAAPMPTAGVENHVGRPPSGHGSAAFSAGD